MGGGSCTNGFSPKKATWGCGGFVLVGFLEILKSGFCLLGEPTWTRTSCISGFSWGFGKWVLSCRKTHLDKNLLYLWVFLRFWKMGFPLQHKPFGQKCHVHMGSPKVLENGLYPMRELIQIIAFCTCGFSWGFGEWVLSLRGEPTCTWNSFTTLTLRWVLQLDSL